jgi:hypothetical protein
VNSCTKTISTLNIGVEFTLNFTLSLIWTGNIFHFFILRSGSKKYQFGILRLRLVGEGGV